MLLRDDNGCKITGVLRFIPRDAQGNQLPIWKETRAGRFLRLMENRLHAGEAVEPGRGPEWHHFLRKGKWARFCGTWALEPLVSTNLLVTAGKAVVASVINGADAEPAVTYLEVGTQDTPGPLITQVDLEAPILTATDATFNRQAATVTREAPTNTTSRLDTTFGVATAAHAVNEAGDFNNSADDTPEMLARSIFTVINISIGGSLQVVYDHLVS